MATLARVEQIENPVVMIQAPVIAVEESAQVLRSG